MVTIRDGHNDKFKNGADYLSTYVVPGSGLHVAVGYRKNQQQARVRVYAATKHGQDRSPAVQSITFAVARVMFRKLREDSEGYYFLFSGSRYQIRREVENAINASTQLGVFASD